MKKPAICFYKYFIFALSKTNETGCLKKKPKPIVFTYVTPATTTMFVNLNLICKMLKYAVCCVRLELRLVDEGE